MTSLNQSTMAELATSQQQPHQDHVSDYGDFGSDAEEIQILDELLASIEPAGRDEERVSSFVVTDIEDYEPPRGILLPKGVLETRPSPSQTWPEPEIEVLRNLEAEGADTRRSEEPEAEPARKPPADDSATAPDTRSPLQRFRKPPQKALSVTDLVSPAWCELQYFYVLSKHGRKRRTVAMKQGSAVHKALEEEIHVTVPVETTKKEDSWGLRIWNVCQGLETLRETGRTRELEIWGTIGGELVNGIIDELSYECPDPNYEENLRTKGVSANELPEYQTSITEYLLAKPEKNASQPQRSPIKKGEKWVYITDVKTRATPTLPTGSSLRPTIAQLHLYHHMLENLVQGNFSLERLTERYNLDPDEVFSDSFIAQLGSLNMELLSESSQDSAGSSGQVSKIPSSQDSMDILLQHNTLASLWQYMIAMFQKTFLLDEQLHFQPATDLAPPPASQQSTSDLPPPPAQPTRLAPLLTAVYMSAARRRAAGSNSPIKARILGHKFFQFNSPFLHAYLSEILPWWRGEREAKGVTLQEAWKCRSCDFKGECAWIQERDQQAFDEAMERRKMREMAGIEKTDANMSTPSRSHI